MIAGSAKTHRLTDAYHYKFDNSYEPALRVASGDTVIFECREATDGQITRESTVEVFDGLDHSRIHSLTGPVAVDEAEPGDVLEVTILDFEHQGWGWTAVEPDYGLLLGDFGEQYALRIWTVGRDGRAVAQDDAVRIPIDPFMGVMGVALAEPGAHSTMPPRHVGGNMDSRHMTKGSTIYFPVEVPGALLSMGDGHLVQGDGEITGLALEAPLTVAVRVTVRKDFQLSAVQYRTPGPTTTKHDSLGYHVTTAAGRDLQDNARRAVREMIDYLEREYGLDRLDAYMLCSLAGDLKIAVPYLLEGHTGFVTYHLPRSIFVGS